MAKKPLPPEIEAILNIGEGTPAVPRMQDPHEIQHYPEPHVVVFEKTAEPVDQRSLDILTKIFNGKAPEAIQKAHDAEVGDRVQIQKTELDTAEVLINRVRDELQSDYDEGYEGHALQFSVMSVSKFTNG